jgi:hypothetical protein
MVATDRRTLVENLAGASTIAITACLYNALATRQNRATISTGIRWAAKQKYGPEITGAITGMLLAHWYLKGHNAN